MCSSSPVRTLKLQLAAEQPLTGESWIPPKNDTPHPRAQEKPQQDCRRGKITFRTKPHTCQRHSEGSNKTVCASELRDPTETAQSRLWVFECLMQRYGLAPASSRGRSSGCNYLGLQTLWHKPSWRSSPLTPPQSRQYLDRTELTDSWRAQTELCAYQDPGERSSDPRRDWPSPARECPGVSSGGVGGGCRAAGLGGTESGSMCLGPSEGGHRYLHHLRHSLFSGQTTGREHSGYHQLTDLIQCL